MKEYLKAKLSIVFCLAFCAVAAAVFSYTQYREQRIDSFKTQSFKTSASAKLIARDIDDLRVQLDSSVLGLENQLGSFTFYKQGGDLMAAYSTLPGRDITIASEGSEAFAPSLVGTKLDSVLILNSKNDAITGSLELNKKLLSDFVKQSSALPKRFFLHKNKVLQEMGLDHFLYGSSYFISQKIEGSDLTLVKKASVAGWLGFFFKAFAFSLLALVPWILGYFLYRRKMSKTFASVGKWARAAACSLRYGRPLHLDESKYTSEAEKLIHAIQSAFAKDSSIGAYSSNEFISQEYNLVSWSYFMRTTSLWLNGQSQADFDVNNGKEWAVVSFTAKSESIMDTFLREANGLFLSKKFFFYRYDDQRILLITRYNDFEELLNLLKSVIKNTIAREDASVNDLLGDALCMSEERSSFENWFANVEATMRELSSKDLPLMKHDVLRFKLFATGEKILGVNWIQLMSGVSNWLKLKAPNQEANQNQRALEANLKPKQFSRPTLWWK